MNRILSATVTAAWMGLRVEASPMGCRDIDQCPSGYYCETDRFCHACLQCEILRRQPPVVSKSCITSASECGPCFKGFTLDSEGQQCTSLSRLLPYEWAVIGVGLFLALLICIATVYILRNFNTFKIRASPSVHSPTERSVIHSPTESSVMIEASAPQLPPPPYSAILPNTEITESSPFIKEVSPPRVGEEYESAVCQTARVFNNPSYIRTLQPLSDDSPAHQTMLSPIHENISDEQSSPNIVSSEAGSLRSNDAEHEVQLVKALQRQEPNNNSEEDTGDTAGARPAAQHNTPVFINIINDARSVQLNEVNLK